MIEVIEKETNKIVTFGELLFEDDNYFKIHSSSEIFYKDNYKYKRKV